MDAPDIRLVSSQAQEIESLRSTITALDSRIAELKGALRKIGSLCRDRRRAPHLALAAIETISAGAILPRSEAPGHTVCSGSCQGPARKCDGDLCTHPAPAIDGRWTSTDGGMYERTAETADLGALLTEFHHAVRDSTSELFRGGNYRPFEERVASTHAALLRAFAALGAERDAACRLADENAQIVKAATDERDALVQRLDDCRDAHAQARASDREVDRLREALAASEKRATEMAEVLYGHAPFCGPCVHGRDPWTRCDVCGEGRTAVDALLAIQRAAECDLIETREALARTRAEALEEAARFILGLADEQGPDYAVSIFPSVIAEHFRALPAYPPDAAPSPTNDSGRDPGGRP